MCWGPLCKDVEGDTVSFLPGQDQTMSLCWGMRWIEHGHISDSDGSSCEGLQEGDQIQPGGYLLGVLSGLTLVFWNDVTQEAFYSHQTYISLVFLPLAGHFHFNLVAAALTDTVGWGALSPGCCVQACRVERWLQLHVTAKSFPLISNFARQDASRFNPHRWKDTSFKMFPNQKLVRIWLEFLQSPRSLNLLTVVTYSVV